MKKIIESYSGATDSYMSSPEPFSQVFLIFDSGNYITVYLVYSKPPTLKLTVLAKKNANMQLHWPVPCRNALTISK